MLLINRTNSSNLASIAEENYTKASQEVKNRIKFKVH
jgi:hypothetical protein